MKRCCWILITVVMLVSALPAAQAAGPNSPGSKPGGGGKSPPNPDIVYMSDDDSTAALYQSAVRGITLTADGLGGRDSSLQKSKAGRSYTNIVWSPGGNRVAWIEKGLGMISTPISIVVAAPGSKGSPVYTYAPGSGTPSVTGDIDSLAWGPDCDDSSASMLVFASYSPYRIYGIRFVDGQAGQPMQLLELPEFDGATPPHAFAFSPTGRHLAFAGFDHEAQYGIWMLPMCTADRTPFMVVSGEEIGGTGWAQIQSMDWSRRGDRLALSVTTGPLPANQWRDLKIVNLNYLSTSAGEQITGHNGVWNVDLDDVFTAASSEHSPQWGPSSPEAACQRLAFSQSSDIAPRSLYLLDINQSYVGGCEVNEPIRLNARVPRALDWK